MNLVVSVDQNWGIGNEGQLLKSVPADLRRFRRITNHNVVVMGRKTLATLPKQKPLPNRTNIILTSDRNFAVPGAEVVHSLPELFDILKYWRDEEIFVIGGQSVYEQLLPYCTYAFITRFAASCQADAHFPNLNKLENWVKKDESAKLEYESLGFLYCLYKNEQPLSFHDIVAAAAK